MTDTSAGSSVPQLSEAQIQAWTREQFQKANKFLAEKGIIPNKVNTSESRYLAPYVAVWKLESTQPTKASYWVISGDLPTDMIGANAAKDARDVIRHFSLAWQLKAENLIQSGAVRDETQRKFANLLIARAQSLFQLHEQEQLWQGQAV
ncbi:hypothetical protein HR45_03525 [Shewanella mangrovi]|uniref:DUF4826 domain-containing protein n=1 Tax=Shewanella mangrovi TaxID=1515746 RepID=A0A094K1I5_9GAMM|nr:DUF4826 family protein [Shewanella mangrovi]KFZ38511.1 hypothetical protein HR45_03525 [Shewanella mangrovi]